MDEIKDNKISVCIILSIIHIIISIRTVSLINLMVEMYNLFNKTNHSFQYISFYFFLISSFIVLNTIVFFYRKKFLRTLIIVPLSSLIINYKANSSFLLNSNLSYSPFSSLYINLVLGLIISYAVVLVIGRKLTNNIVL